MYKRQKTHFFLDLLNVRAVIPQKSVVLFQRKSYLSHIIVRIKLIQTICLLYFKYCKVVRGGATVMHVETILKLQKNELYDYIQFWDTSHILKIFSEKIPIFEYLKTLILHNFFIYTIVWKISNNHITTSNCVQNKFQRLSVCKRSINYRVLQKLLPISSGHIST